MADQLNPLCLLSLYLTLGMLSTFTKLTPWPSKKIVIKRVTKSNHSFKSLDSHGFKKLG